MSKTTRPGQEGKVFIADFENVIEKTFGRGIFSAFQIKQVFKMHAEGDPSRIENMSIKVKDFKDLYYP